MVVNSMGWTVDLGYQLIKHTVQVRTVRAVCAVRGQLGVAGPRCRRRGLAACMHQMPPTTALRIPHPSTRASPHPRPRPPSLTVPVPPRSRATPPAPSPACMQALKCGVVLVVGDERLFSQLSGDLRRADASIEVRGGGMGGRGGVWDVCVGGGRRP